MLRSGWCRCAFSHHLANIPSKWEVEQPKKLTGAVCLTVIASSGKWNLVTVVFVSASLLLFHEAAKKSDLEAILVNYEHLV